MTTQPTVYHVTLTNRDGSPILGTYQWRNQDDAEVFAADMRQKQGATATVAPGPLRTQKIKARSLNDDDVLANGAVRITRLYFGTTKVRVTGLRMVPSLRMVRRAYDPDQLVEIEARS